jgi:hypothetical protein
MMRSIYVVFLYADAIQKLFFLGGSRARTVTMAKIMNGMIRNPMIRTDHPNPKEELFNIFDKAMGMICDTIRRSIFFAMGLSTLENTYNTTNRRPRHDHSKSCCSLLVEVL